MLWLVFEVSDVISFPILNFSYKIQITTGDGEMNAREDQNKKKQAPAHAPELSNDLLADLHPIWACICG